MDFIDLKSQYAALKPRIAERMQRVLDHGQYIMGPEVQELEQQLAAYTGAAHCITVASGTEALLIALMAIGLKPGDEVITTTFSFAATAEVIVLLGGRPVFVDIEPDTCNIDAAQVEARITPRTRAILPVSLYGQCADMAALNAIAARHGLESLVLPVRGVRAVGKKQMIHNDATPMMEVDPETYQVRADGALLTCEPAAVLPMAQRYFLF